MKTAFVSQNGESRLILIFAGWAMDDAPFRHLHRPGYDIAVVWDYRELAPITPNFVKGYNEVCIVAWSLGVFASSLTTDDIAQKITRRVAVNGTLIPVDDEQGIPRVVFEGTLNGLNERNLQKFYRRVAGSHEQYEAFAQTMPRRDIGELADELRLFLSLPQSAPSTSSSWDVAIIGSYDAIFPPANQRRAWSKTVTEELEAPHLIDLQSVIDRHIVDKSRVGERFAKGRASYDAAAHVQSDIIDHLWRSGKALLKDVLPERDAKILEIGSGSGLLSRLLLAAKPTSASLEMWDICGEAPLDGPATAFRRCDAEPTIGTVADESLDVIASASTVQWFNSPRRFLEECARVLNPGGLVLLTSFIKGNLAEVSAVTGKSLPLFTHDQWLAIVPSTIKLQYCHTYDYQLVFDNPMDVFRHLRATGVNSLDRSANGRSLKAALKAYPRTNDGKCPLTYKPIILILRKK